MKALNLSRKQKVYIAAFITVVSIMLWAFITAGIITHDFNRSQLATDQNKHEATINGIILTETKDEKKYWEIYGETGSYDSTNEVAMMDNVIGNFYKDDKVSMSFQSTKGTYNASKKTIVLYQDTFVVLHDGTTLNADRLRFEGNDNPIVAKGNVKITRGKQFVAFADEIIIAPDFQSFKIIGHAVSKIYEEKK